MPPEGADRLGERVRVLRLIARMNVGGPALQVTALTQGLDPERFCTRLLVGNVREGEGDYLALRARDLAVERVPGLGRSPSAVGDMHALRAVVREVRDFRPHIVHTHTAKAGVIGRVAARICGTPLVVHTYHGHLLHGYFSPPVTKAVVAIERRLARRTDRIVAVGDRVRQELLAAGIGRPEQYEVVPPGTTLEPLPPAPASRRELGVREDGVVVTFVGRLVGVKRPDRFLEAAAMVARRHAHVSFVVAGDGTMRAELERVARRFGARVSFVGWRPDVETVYAASDIVVLTSDNEGMPVSLIEAAMASKPVVATDAGSTSEVVADGETGFVVASTPDAIADAVSKLVADKGLRDRMGAAASERAAGRFGRQRLIADMERIYSQLLAGTRGS